MKVSLIFIKQKERHKYIREFYVLEKDIFQTELGKGSVELVSYENNKIILKTQNSKPGLLILTDSYDKGWKVRIDDQDPVPVLRANLNLRAVLVPEGTHQLTFKYLPDSFRWGIYIFVISFLSLLTSPLWLKILVPKVKSKKLNSS